MYTRIGHGDGFQLQSEPLGLRPNGPPPIPKVRAEGSRSDAFELGRAGKMEWCGVECSWVKWGVVGWVVNVVARARKVP
jgi:hypothetical protein